MSDVRLSPLTDLGGVANKEKLELELSTKPECPIVVDGENI